MSDVHGDNETKRVKMPPTRDSISHKFTISGRGFDGNPKDYDCYLIVGLYADGRPGEIFARLGKLGGRQGALLDAWCVLFSIYLQHGHPLDTLVDRFKHTRFEPAGYVIGCEDIPKCASPIDYIVKWLEYKFLTEGEEA